jgi:cobyrinic acid a,c-diamide synthase
MELLARQGCQVQHFHSRATFPLYHAALSITGLGSRHLDTWLMSKDVCRELFVHGIGDSNLALVEGQFESPVECRSHVASAAARTLDGRFDKLCDWLDFPRLVVLDASHFVSCALPVRPDQVDGVFLDHVQTPADLYRLQATLEALWEVPVLGALTDSPSGPVSSVRKALTALPRGSVPPRELLRPLGDELARFFQGEALLELAARRGFPRVRPALFRAPRSSAEEPEPITVGVAFDKAFNCYFPDTLDLLEMLGAKVIDFSPLRDEVLPECDVVYLGCGHPERAAEALTENHCMLLAMRNHVRSGGRVYAEGGGLAYLCEHLVTPEGRSVPMVGVLPAVARYQAQPRPPAPVEVTLSKGTWLGHAGTRLRGYLNSNWSIEPLGGVKPYVTDPGHEFDLLGRFQVLGSRIHLNFAAQRDMLWSFFEPRVAELSLSI